MENREHSFLLFFSGIKEGIKEGTKRTSYKFILKMHKKGMPIEDIAEICDEFSEEQIKEIISNETV